jgi:hypothetical protein
MITHFFSCRDPLCPKTLYNLYTKAKAPEKLFVRVLQQRDPDVDGDCLEDYCKLVAKDRGKNPDLEQDILKDCPYSNQIFINEIHAKDAAGPTWARGLLSKDIELAYKKGELNTQDHCMSIDSHMDFEQHWDDRMVEMWEDSLNEYAVLSTYVQDVEHLGEVDNGKPHHQTPHLCMIKYTSNVRTHATKCVNDLSKPKLTNVVWGAGLSFSKCHAELKVMVDPHTPHIFDGEEFNRAARFWTYGYDIYTPNHVYVLHDYHKSQSNPIMHTWYANTNVHGSFTESNKRLRTMIDLPNGEEDPAKVQRMKLSKFGLGDRRTLDQLINFSGFDLRHEKVTIDGKNRCGNIQWVPFTEHPKGVNYIPSFDNETEDPLDPYDPSSIWYKDGDNEEGLPENLDLDKKHAALQEEVEAEEVVMNGLDEKHSELLKEIQEAEDQASNEAEVEVEELVHGNDANNGEDAVEGENVEEAQDIVNMEVEEVEEVEAAATEELKAPPSKVGPLRGIKEKAHHGAEVVSEFIAKHPLPTGGKIEHGFSHLPMFVKLNVFFLIFGVGIAIMRNAGTGRSFKKKNKKRAL